MTNKVTEVFAFFLNYSYNRSNRSGEKFISQFEARGNK